MAYDDYNREAREVEQCLANLHHTLRVSGTVYHKHLQARLANLEEQLSNESVVHEIYRAQGRVKELKRLLEDLFPHNEA